MIQSMQSKSIERKPGAILPLYWFAPITPFVLSIRFWFAQWQEPPL